MPITHIFEVIKSQRIMGGPPAIKGLNCEALGRRMEKNKKYI
jgi:hypothetical protein